MTGRKVCNGFNLAALVLAAVVTARLGAREARPPKWSSDVQDTFFDDAREKLEGPRPDYTQSPDFNQSPKASELQHAGDIVDESSRFSWSLLIAPNTLETEVKRLSQFLAKSVTTPSQFKGGGFKDARREFTELAVIFAVTALYDGDARWKDIAAGLRDSFSQAAANSKFGNDTTYREATLRKQDLAELIRGSRPKVPQADAAVADWSQIVTRPPLMQRLETAHQQRLLQWLADSATFQRNRTEIAHEAQIVALLANVIRREAFEYWDDETFADYAIDLQQAATDISSATDADNYEQARAAVSRATSACANCHDGYRG